MSGTKAEWQDSDLFPFRCRYGEGWVSRECLVIGIVKERHVVTHIPEIGEVSEQARIGGWLYILGLVVIDQLSLQLLRSFECGETIVFVIPPPLSHP